VSNHLEACRLLTSATLVEAMRSLEKSGLAAEALEAYRRGIEAAHTKGDKQAEKEMTVFMRRLEKAARAPGKDPL